MTLEAKRVAYDADDKLLQYVRRRAYPNYSFADITRYYSDETKLVAEILAGANQKNCTLLSREEFMARSGLSLEEMKALIKTTVKTRPSGHWQNQKAHLEDDSCSFQWR